MNKESRPSYLQDISGNGRTSGNTSSLTHWNQSREPCRFDSAPRTLILLTALGALPDKSSNRSGGYIFIGGAVFLAADEQLDFKIPASGRETSDVFKNRGLQDFPTPERTERMGNTGSDWVSPGRNQLSGFPHSIRTAQSNCCAASRERS